MKKLLSLGLVLLLWTSVPLLAGAELGNSPESSPSPSVESAQPAAPSSPPSENSQPAPSPPPIVETGTLPELPVPGSDMIPSAPADCPTASSPAPVSQSPVEPSIFDFLEGSCATAEVDMISYYLTEMSAAAVRGDTEAGREAQENRNALIDRNGSQEIKIAFDDLYLLSKLIYAEAGSDWLSDDFRLCVGEVVLNRVASPEFPDTLYDVIYQKNQYSSVSSPGFASLIPNQDCVDVAIRLLQGERQMAPSVVFQSNFAQGDIFSIHKDRRLGDTFFCVSPNLELYP